MDLIDLRTLTGLETPITRDPDSDPMSPERRRAPRPIDGAGQAIVKAQLPRNGREPHPAQRPRFVAAVRVHKNRATLMPLFSCVTSCDPGAPSIHYRLSTGWSA